MTTFRFLNFFTTELDLGIAAGSTTMSIPLAAAVKMGTIAEDEAVRLVLWNGQDEPEIVDAISNPLSGVVEITRALEGTTALDWPAGTQVQQVITAELLTTFMASFFDVDLLLGANFLPLAGGILSGPLTLAGPPGAGNEAANRSWVEGLLGTFLSLAGGTMSGDIDLAGTQRILRLAAPTVADHAATKAYVDATAGIATAQFNDESGVITTGTSTAYVAASNRTGLALVDGLTVAIRPHVTNGKDPTLDFAGLGARALQNFSGQNIEAGLMRAGMPLKLTYQASTTSWLIHGQTNDDGVPGDLKHSMQMVDHGNWLICDGRAINRVQYNRLFTVMGTKWGVGDGSTTFNIPDLRGRALAGADNMGGVSANRLTIGGSGIDATVLGSAGGNQGHTLITAELPAHTHAVSGTSGAAGAHNHTTGAATKIVEAPSQSVTNIIADYNAGAGLPDVIMAQNMTAAVDHTHAISITSAATGADTAHRNVQPTGVCHIFVHI